MTTKITPSVLANTAVTAGSYGSVSVSPSVIIDAQGRVIGAGNNTISIDTSQLTSGTLADVRLPGQASLTASDYRGNTNTAIAIVTMQKVGLNLLRMFQYKLQPHKLLVIQHLLHQQLQIQLVPQTSIVVH